MSQSARPIKLLLGGDVSPQGTDVALFSAGAAENLVGVDLLGHFRAADLTVVNLETVLTDHPAPINKSGRCLKAPENTVQLLSALGIDAVNLANNHVLDHGEAGLMRTLAVLDQARISHWGAGPDAAIAAQPFVRECQGHRIGIIGCCEHEFSVCRQGATANGVDLIQLVPLLESLREQCELLIVLYHGGKEYYPLPSPDQQRLCRFLIERGADAVVCQHTHIVGAVESWRQGVIFYGQGNFLFRMPNPLASEGFLLEFSLGGHRDWTWRQIPFALAEHGVRALSSEVELAWRQRQDEYRLQVADSATVVNRWENFCKKKTDIYLSALHGDGRYMGHVLRKMGLHRFIYRQNAIALLRNLFSCEIHREVVRTILDQQLRK